MSYCTFCKNLPTDNIHKIYHDQYYGVELTNDFELFGRLILEINQAGLSWETILKKQEFFFEAFDKYDFYKVAVYDDSKIESLLQNKGIIRNKLKINAVIHNANKMIEIVEQNGSFLNWLSLQGEITLEEWVKLFKKNFKFVGKEIVNEFLMSINLLPGAHDTDCEKYKQNLKI
jgi:DNA-3-methyladenine glycosylase I